MNFKDLLLFLEENSGKTVVIFPGGFHPFHLGHKSVFDLLQQKFPNADHYIAITGYTKDRPFELKEKIDLMKAAGVNIKNIKEVKNPFRSEEILRKYNPKTDKVVFVASEKEKLDPEKKSLFTRVKKDGSPSYFQDYSSNMETFDKHGYIITLPTVKFNVLGNQINSASELRALYKSLDNNKRIELIEQLYTKDFKKVKNILDKHLF